MAMNIFGDFFSSHLDSHNSDREKFRTLKNLTIFAYPAPSMGRLYIYLHEWLISMVNFSKYTIHGS